MSMSVKKRNTWFIRLFLFLSAAVGLSVWISAGNIEYTTITSKDGIWDLRGVDLQNQSVRLAGDVEYVPGALLSSDEFAVADNIALGEIPDGTSYLTSRVRLLVPAGYLEIAGFADDFGSRVFLNGKQLTDSGSPAENHANNVPSERFIKFTAEPVDGIIEIVQQASNFVFRTNTSHIGWTIGSHENIERFTTGFSFSYSVNIGFYLALLLAHLLLFFVLPSYRANLWFALLCFAWVVRSGVVRVRPLVVLLGIDWATALRAEYLTAVSALVLITLAYDIIFPGALSKRLCQAMYAMSGAWALLYIIAEIKFISETMLYYEIIACIWAIYVLFRIIYKRRLNQSQKIIFAGLSVILAGVILDSLFYNGIVLPFMHNAVLETAVLIFSLFQMAAMFLGTMEQVAAARAAEQKLAQENAALERMNRLKTDLMTTISHEARTPLAVLASYAGIVSIELSQKGVSEQTAADLDKIVSEAKRVADLIDSMKRLTMHDADTAKRIKLNIGEMIRQVAGLYRPALERSGVTLNADIDKELAVYGNPEELTQVVFNILQNAKEHTESGGISIAAARENDRITITVCDTGRGLTPSILARAFERGVSGKDGGMGIGLAICKDIVDAHGGTIKIANGEQSGAVVTLTLPAYREDARYDPEG